MRILPTRWHGLLDYLVAVLLLTAPAIFGLPAGAASYVPMILGMLTIIYSLFTDYEWGRIRLIPMRVHLLLDGANGLLLAASPWLFGFSELSWKPHLIIGLTELLVTITSKSRAPAKQPQTRYKR